MRQIHIAMSSSFALRWSSSALDIFNGVLNSSISIMPPLPKSHNVLCPADFHRCTPSRSLRSMATWRPSALSAL